MTLERFQDALDTYGGDLSRWPDALARSAETLLSHEPAARALLQQAKLLDAALAPDELPAVESALTDRIMRRVAEHRAGLAEDRVIEAEHEDGRPWLLRLIWPVPRELVAMCSGTVAGVLVGLIVMKYLPYGGNEFDLFNLASASNLLG